MKNRTFKTTRLWLSVAALVLFSSSLLRAQTAAPNAAQDFDKTEKMITMRDGARLYTEVFVPRNVSKPLPIIFLRTPYGVTGWGERAINGFLKELVDEGYIFAFQDIRGRFKSESTFVMQRPPRTSTDPKAIDEGTDTYDTIEWMVKN